jgi:deazaflavin-dependent oxidoreductase (nitroreductase family)
MGWNDDLIAHFRKNRGTVTEGPFAGRPVLLLTTTGKTTGRRHTTPLVYSRDGDRYLIIASKGGAPTSPDWYFNLLKHPEVTVEVGPETFRAKAIPHSRGSERRRLYDQHAGQHPGFKDYEKKTTRQIPTILLERLSA